MKGSIFKTIGTWCLLFAFPTSSLAQRDWQTYPLSVISQVPEPETFENIAVRSSGQILLTSTASPKLFQASPLFRDRLFPVANIPQAQGLLGIVELDENIFYVVSSNISNSRGLPGSNKVWRVDLRHVGEDFISENSSTTGEVTLVATIENAVTLNGMCRLGQSDHILLIADSAAGQIFSVDVKTGSYKVVMDDPILHSTPHGLQVAVDGIHIHGSEMFFTNFNRGIFAKIPLSLSSGNATGRADIIVNNTSGDDFVVSPDGKKAWLAMNGNGTVVEVDIAMKSSVVIAQSSALSAAAAVTFGKTRFDRNSLYIASGGVLNPRESLVNEGILARIDLPNPI